MKLILPVGDIIIHVFIFHANAKIVFYIDIIFLVIDLVSTIYLKFYFLEHLKLCLLAQRRLDHIIYLDQIITWHIPSKDHSIMWDTSSSQYATD
jgi:hypothetical protein